MVDSITSISVGGVERLGQETTWTGDSNSFALALLRNMGREPDFDTAWWSTFQHYDVPQTKDVLGFNEIYNYMQISPDGKRLYVEVSNQTTDDRIAQWNLARPWDIQSIEQEAGTFIYGGTAQLIRWFMWSDDGSKLFLHQTNRSVIEQFNANVPFEVGSINSSVPEKTADLTAGGLLSSWKFVQNGRRLITLATSSPNVFFESWTLDTSFDIETINYEAKSQNIRPFGFGFGLTRFFDFVPGGKVIYIAASQDSAENFPLFRVVLSNAYDVTSIPSSLPTSASTGDFELATRLGLNSTAKTSPTRDFLYAGVFFSPDAYSFLVYSNQSFLTENVGRFFRLDLACSGFNPPSSAEANAETEASIGSKSSAPYINRNVADSQFLSGNCITIQSTAVGACSSEEVAVVKVGDVDFTISNKNLGNDSFCGDLEAHLLDSYGVQNATATNFVTGADHLAGEVVAAWGDGQDLGFYKVSSTGTFTIPVASTSVTYGLPYNAWFKSVKLAYSAQAEAGTPLLQRKKVNYLGFVLYCAHARGLEYGPSTDKLNPMPRIESGKLISPDAIWPHYDKESIEFPGEWDTDSRVVLKARAPRGVTVLAAITQVDTREKI